MHKYTYIHAHIHRNRADYAGLSRPSMHCAPSRKEGASTPPPTADSSPYNELTQRGLSCTLPAIPMRRRTANCWSHRLCRVGQLSRFTRRYCRESLLLLLLLHLRSLHRLFLLLLLLFLLLLVLCPFFPRASNIRPEIFSTVTGDAIFLLIETARGARNF